MVFLLTEVKLPGFVLLTPQVVQLLKVTPPIGSQKKHVLLNKEICQQAFKRLLGIGAARYSRLRASALKGGVAPLDGRRLKKPLVMKRKISIRKRSLVVEYLQELYTTVSEPMPEATQSLRKLRENLEREVEIKSSIDMVLPAKAKAKPFRRSRGRRPKMAGKIHRGKIREDIHVLPPGSYSDYHRLFNSRHPEDKVSLKLFLTETWAWSIQNIF